VSHVTFSQATTSASTFIAALILIYQFFDIVILVATERSTDLQSFKAEFFKALAHPIRIRILEILRSRDRSVQELQALLDLDQSTVSQQLAVLRAKNIVTARKEGTTVRYAVRDALVGDLLDVARRIFNNQLSGTQTMLRQLRQEARRPARR
jgi:DNA-binding transcriptional ArsR family regulator